MYIKSQTGLSLTELMVGIFIGIFIVAGAIKLFTGSVSSRDEVLKINHLNQDLRTMMDVMTGEIRRAGYIRTTTNLTETQFLTAIRTNPFDELKVENGGTCLVYQYDKSTTTPGQVDNADRMGFKLETGELKMRRTATDLSCATSNTSTRWEGITSPEVKITQLNFSLQITPLSIAQRKNNPSSAPVACSLVGEECLIMRDMSITLTGQLNNDASVNQKLNETVRLRNDQYCIVATLTPLTCVVP